MSKTGRVENRPVLQIPDRVTKPVMVAKSVGMAATILPVRGACEKTAVREEFYEVLWDPCRASPVRDGPIL